MADKPDESFHSLAPGILIATPSLKDPFFAHSVVLLVEHNENGAVGVIVNRKSPLGIDDVLNSAGISNHDNFGQDAVWWGGPVQPELGMLLYRNQDGLDEYEPQIKILPDLHASWSLELLSTIAAGEGPETFCLFLGQAAWRGGQLEKELNLGAWIPCDANPDLLFTFATRACWTQALQELGINKPSQAAFSTPAQA